MKVDFKAGNERYSIEFGISPGYSDGTHFVAMAKTSKDLDKLQDYISKRSAGDAMIGDVIAKVVSKKLNLPVERSHRYNGAGFGLALDTYSIAKKLS